MKKNLFSLQTKKEKRLHGENGTIKTNRQQAERAKELYSVETGAAAYLKLYQGER